eukprot:g30014.t1
MASFPHHVNRVEVNRSSLMRQVLKKGLRRLSLPQLHEALTAVAAKKGVRSNAEDVDNAVGFWFSLLDERVNAHRSPAQIWEVLKQIAQATDYFSDCIHGIFEDPIFLSPNEKGLPQLMLRRPTVLGSRAWSARSEVERAELLAEVAAAQGPKLTGTKVVPLRLYEKPGPMVRKSSTVSSSSGPISARSGQHRILTSAAQALLRLGRDGTSSYQEVFQAFCGPRNAMDGAAFSKLCKDCRLLDRRFSPADADLIFTKVCPRGHRRIGLEQFEEAVWLIGRKRGLEYGSLLESIANSAGPLLKATQTQARQCWGDGWQTALKWMQDMQG